MKTSRQSGSLTVQNLSVLAEQLRAAPAREYQPWADGRALTRLEAVAFLKDELIAVRDKGYSVVEIAAMLSNAGFPITEAGLYEAMRKLGYGLGRQTVTTADRLKQHLCQGSEGLHARSSIPRDRKMAEPKSVPMDLSGVQGPRGGVIHIEADARPLIERLSPAHSLMYQEVLKQLREGEQVVRLDPHLSDIKDIFIDLGLLTLTERQGESVYEVPAEIARVHSGPGQPSRKRPVRSRASK